jgi:hypothetical protein
VDLALLKRLRRRFQKAEHRLSVVEHELMLLELRVRELEDRLTDQPGETKAEASS